MKSQFGGGTVVPPPLIHSIEIEPSHRTITRLASEEVQERMAERVAANPQIMRRRKAIIEHCFGTIKRSLGYDYFLCRGLRNVATEINLTMLAYNLKRVCNLVGVKNLIAAVS
jgi:Transposase DDE domain